MMMTITMMTMILAEVRTSEVSEGKLEFKFDHNDDNDEDNDDDDNHDNENCRGLNVRSQ